MKSKYYIAVLASIVVALGTLLSACGGETAQPTAAQPSVQPTVAQPAAQPTTAQPAAQPTTSQATPKKTVRVALVLDGKIDDGGWNQAGYEGLMLAKQQYGVETAYSEQVPIADYEKALRDYANQGYDLIIAHSSIAKDAVVNTAKDFPKLAFLWTDGDATSANQAVIRPMSQEASYLAGILAGKMTKSNVVGMVGGIDIPSTHRSYAGFEQGLKEVNPNAKLLVNWIGSFLDVSKGKEAALSQIESGADVIFGNGDGQNIGVLQAAGEKNVLAIGAVRDQFQVAPNVVLTSVQWGFSSGIARVVGDVVQGKFKGQFYEIGLAQGADLAPYHDNASKIPDDVKKLIDDKRQGILSGTIKVPVVDK